MPARNPFRWSPKAGRYVKANGRFLSKAEVRAGIDAALAKEGAKAVRLSQELRNGTISLGQWRSEMREMVKTVHVYNGAIAKGGFAQMTKADYGRVGQIVRREYGFLEKFAEGISNGTVPLDGRLEQRAIQYAEAGRGTYHQIERTVMMEAGYTREFNILHPAEHCGGCLAETARGKVPIGSLVPVGSRTCRRRCRCTLGYD